ncbi:hypothetical protein [Vibrio vulnificus]|uniref:hypothetical protein n=1 Tax=Vibrio vulnificus TaxID=672 RepID=UPI001EE9DB11|nr:hypothetical protein [Vibrio vulnificus]MDS1769798.1 hypothetical protein [Vibrio vulnificus]MDS1851465.1 hypothetical protein [Vibrio vulnificus]MDS1862725.1 hypothetical protein [Vibrio vulnificus]
MKYEDITMLDAPVLEDGVEVFGYLRIHRRQVKKKEASRVVILVTRSLLNIIEASKDNIDSPYVVYRLPEKRSNDVSQYCDHLTQVNRKYLSRFFFQVTGPGEGQKRCACRLSANVSRDSRAEYSLVR